MNKIEKFISGNEYNLQHLFGGDNKIVIPDLQRDYCWGDKVFVGLNDKTPRELVSDFIKNIVELFNENNSIRLTLGLIYGYEQPRNHIQICDGQQRLTTLFLLLGYVNTKAKGCFNDFIISEKEMNDDFEPHLQYAIRESTLYFLSDLSLRTFIENTTSIEGIRSSNWYFNEYNQDASIQSMVSALETIDKFFSDPSLKIDYINFGNFILNNIYVLYYDMENRSRGEETYVVINTTGEPLSATENIKPILLGKTSLSDKECIRFGKTSLSDEESIHFRKTSLRDKECIRYSNQWEAREDWFWENRGKDKTADEGMQVFFMWYWQIGLIQENNWVNGKKFPLNIKELFTNTPKKNTDNANEVKLSIDNYYKFQSLDNLDTYFNALKDLVNEIYCNSRIQKVVLSMVNEKMSWESSVDVWSWLRHSDLHIVLPLIAFIAKFGKSESFYSFVRRLRRNYFDGLWSKNNNDISRRGKNYMDWRYLVQIINQTTEADLLNIDIETINVSKIPNIELPIWYNEDEKVKDQYKAHLSILEEMEDNEFLMGDLTAIWYDGASLIYSPETIIKRWNVLNRITKALDEKEALKDIQFANWFRLYRLVTGISSIGHIKNCKWNFEGCFYSRKPDSPWWIESKEIESLIQAEDPVFFMKQYVKQNVSDYIRCPSNHRELIKSWMTIKTIQAERGNKLINYWNDRSLSAFIDLKSNYIIPKDKFCWGNVYCGYSYSYTIYPARDKLNWENKKNLDSPITSISYIDNFYNRKPDIIDSEIIERGDLEVKEVIDAFLEM